MNRLKNIGKRKYRLNSKEMFSAIINKELEKHKVTIDDVIEKEKKGEYLEQKWFKYYTFDTLNEYLRWKDYCIKLITDECYPKINLKKAIRYFGAIEQGFGLRKKFLEKNN